MAPQVVHVFRRQYIIVNTSKTFLCRNNKMVADAVLEKEYVKLISLMRTSC